LQRLEKPDERRQTRAHDNGGAARDWKVLSIRPPLRGARALGDIPLQSKARRELLKNV